MSEKNNKILMTLTKKITNIGENKKRMFQMRHCFPEDILHKSVF